LHIIFSDSSFPNTPVDPPTPIHAVISSKQDLDTFSLHVEHGFVVGIFKVHVGKQWDRLEMKQLSWSQRRRVKLS
jgi:hypothetical protein